MHAVLSVVGILVSIATLGLVYAQVRAANESTKAAIFVGLVRELYANVGIRILLSHIEHERLVYAPARSAFEIQENDKAVDITQDVFALLNRLQLVGNLCNSGTLRIKDVQGIRYEVLIVGRNSEIRSFFEFLNVEWQDKSGVVHDHFRDFKTLYLKLEYDHRQRRRFDPCVFDYPESVASWLYEDTWQS